MVEPAPLVPWAALKAAMTGRVNAAAAVDGVASTPYPPDVVVDGNVSNDETPAAAAADVGEPMTSNPWPEVGEPPMPMPPAVTVRPPAVTVIPPLVTVSPP